VVLDITITLDGRVTSPHVLRGPGLGLEEKAMTAVKNWKMRPCTGPNGKPVACSATIEIGFRLL
jgi:protein TonB